MFRVSLVKADKMNTRHALKYEPIENTKFQELRTKKLKLVRVIRRNRAIEEATWELE